MLKILSLIQELAKFGPALAELAKYGPILLQLLKTFQDSLEKARNMEALTLTDGDLDVALNQKIDEIATLIAYKVK